MKNLFYSILYVVSIGILSNPIARLIPRRFDTSRFPFSLYAFENKGKLYDKLFIKRWKDLVPDMSRVLKRLISKKLDVDAGEKEINTLVQESCVSELVHNALMLLSLLILPFWHSAEAIAFIAAYNFIGNIPFIMIQRYNRPRLERVLKKASGIND